MIRQQASGKRAVVRSALPLLSLVCITSLHAGKLESGVAESAGDVRPVAVGTAAPGFSVATVGGERFVFDPGKLERPAIIISFRGGWCPYCNMHLSELRHVLPEITAMGIDVLFLSGDRPELLYRSLEEDTQASIEGRGYRILSDADASAAIALGIAFRASARTIGRRHERGDDIAGSSMMNHGILPVPAVFAVGTDGLVSFSFFAPDYKIRLPADELLEVARTMTGC